MAVLYYTNLGSQIPFLTSLEGAVNINYWTTATNISGQEACNW